MKKIHNLKDWRLDEHISSAERFAFVTISLKYPDQKQFIEFKPKERIKKIDQDHKTNLNKLITLNLFDNYQVTGTKKRPRGIEGKVKYSLLTTLNKLDFIGSIMIRSIDNAPGGGLRGGKSATGGKSRGERWEGRNHAANS